MLKQIGASPLLVASEQGHDDVVKLLCEYGADVNASLYDDVTPTFLSAQNGNVKVLKLLLNYNADVNIKRAVSIHLTKTSKLKLLLKTLILFSLKNFYNTVF